MKIKHLKLKTENACIDAKSAKRSKREKRVIIVLFLAIPLVLLLLFTYKPLCDMIYWSFFNKRLASPRKEYTQFGNYLNIFKRTEYISVLKVSLYYMVGSFVQIALAIYLATVFAFKMKGKNFFKGVLFFPSLLNGVAIGFMFIFFFERGGALDTILCALGCDQESLPKWLGQANIVNISLTFVSVWRYMGQNMVLFSGATQSIGTEYFEAAELDGANKWQQFRYLIFPGIKSVVMLNLILAVKGSLQVYEVPKIITNGLFGSTTFVMKILDTAFAKNQYGFACALGVALLILTLVITGIQKLFFERDERKERKGNKAI